MSSGLLGVLETFSLLAVVAAGLCITGALTWCAVQWILRRWG